MFFNRKNSKKWKLNIVMATVCVIITVSGCGKQGEETEEAVLLVDQNTALDYSMGVVTKEDVSLEETILCTYQQTLDEEISFNISGKRIDKIYVNTGDAVTKGQLLAELKNENAREEVQRLEYQIARNKVLLQSVDENEKNDIDELMAHFTYDSDGSDAAKVKMNQDVEDLKQANRYAREDYQDAIDLDQRELDELQTSINECKVYAGISGTVSQIKAGLEGSTSARGEKIMTIIDSSDGVFQSEDIEFSTYFKEDKSESIMIGAGAAAEPYEVTPYQMSTWGEKMYFNVKDEAVRTSLPIGTTGKLKIITDEVKQVLAVPNEAVHMADGKSFVYVVGEQGMREVRWVETGLQGNDKTEIKSGLAEGEKVVLGRHGN